MRLSDIGEFGLIARLETLVGSLPDEVVCGIGDDCAVLDRPGKCYFLLTCDTLVETVHFRNDWCTPEQLGEKSIAVNLSDIAAMGGAPLAATISIALPKQVSVDFVERLYRGMHGTAARHRLSVVGGDTVRSPDVLSITVSVLGEVRKDRLLLRSGARVGDAILVTETLGASAAGLSLLLEGQAERYPRLVHAHHCPVPRLREAQVLAATGRVHAAIDLSDGLAGDLRHILERSRVAAEVWLDHLPINSDCREAAAFLKQDVIRFACQGGEDYELLLTAHPADVPSLQSELQSATGTTLTTLGRITEAPAGKITWMGPREASQALASAYDHFPENASSS